MRLTKYITELSATKKHKINYIRLDRDDEFNAEIVLDLGDKSMAKKIEDRDPMYMFYFESELIAVNNVFASSFKILADAKKAYYDKLENANNDWSVLGDKGTGAIIAAPAVWDITFEDAAGRMELLNYKGKDVALNLFAVLEKVFKEFIKRKDPLLFHFMADVTEKSRVKLYNLLAKRISKNGYDFNYHQRGSYIFYLFTVKGIDEDWWLEQNMENA